MTLEREKFERKKEEKQRNTTYLHCMPILHFGLCFIFSESRKDR